MYYIGILLQLLSASVASYSVSYSPKSICVFERSSVDFTCTFSYPSYRTLKTTKWFRPDKDQKQDGSQEGIFVHHSQAVGINQLYKNRTAYANQDKNCSLQLRNVSKSDIGRYFFRFETEHYYGKFTGSGGISLNVAVPPFRVTVKMQRTNEQIHEGDSVTLTCSAENCTPTRGPFAWFKNRLLLPEATENVLRIPSVSHHDMGNYSCGLTNSNTTSGDETSLDVRYGPKNVEISILSSEEIQEGNPLTLICTSNANPAVSNYTWFKIRETNVSHVRFDRVLSVKAVSQGDDGQYFCTATNDMGSQNSSVIALKVKVPTHRIFLPTASAVFVFLMALLLILFALVIRRKQFILKKQTTEQTPAIPLTEEIYENLRTSPENLNTVLYADLRLPPSTSERPCCSSQECDTVIYSLLNHNE